MNSYAANFRAAVIARFMNRMPSLLGLDTADVDDLFSCVMHENECFDGEEVSVDHMVKLMKDRHAAVGLIPSRN